MKIGSCLLHNNISTASNHEYAGDNSLAPVSSKLWCSESENKAAAAPSTRSIIVVAAAKSSSYPTSSSCVAGAELHLVLQRWPWTRCLVVMKMLSTAGIRDDAEQQATDRGGAVAAQVLRLVRRFGEVPRARGEEGIRRGRQQGC
ncbi:hypothetical protein PAHAL_5G364800 [Panicum hallii]|jgi:hypothetical protein|uniref:Uncharacterized protein n=1 Tax=Panicum hallii TaxID=206008 RepID=A0A2S3HVF3_9POAL|nr:hypothetical protein PAHAL_5G364800 [Panicum hallii]